MPERGVVNELTIALLLVAIVVVGIVDVFLDGAQMLWTTHFFVELLMIVLSLGTAAFMFYSWKTATVALKSTRASLGERERERDAWRTRAEGILAGLGEAIDRQLGDWQLTPVERETALMILKGLSHREIAEVCGRSERTVRQHAVAVYRKSGLSGRAELSAFFLEDLLLPAPSSTHEERAG